jgi:hypothetical protein
MTAEDELKTEFEPFAFPVPPPPTVIVMAEPATTG